MGTKETSEYLNSDYPNIYLDNVKEIKEFLKDMNTTNQYGHLDFLT